ncbi:glycosyltransferase [Gallibacterium anatis]|uniref:glycosyltransferase n=1 Tax=Gallibacterium anatis TaxID=750 RepID=UPI00053115FC|nr:glycosyltransferase [Gallibacterium anatis]KGQ27586.1 hypothetical protein JP27_04905 [Gallibacterium anatis]
MKKILIFSYHLSGFGGTESVLNEWFKHLNKKNGYELELLIYGRGGYPDHSFSKNKNVNMFPHETGLKRIKTLYRLRKKISANNYDYILCLGLNHLKGVFLALDTLPNLMKRPKVFYWTHFRIEPDQFNNKTKKLLQRCDGILSLCEGMTKQFDYFDISSNKLYTIYNPINRANFKPNSSKGNTFYYIGRLYEEQKRVSDIIKAFHLLINKEKLDCNLIIIGIGQSYDFYKYLIDKYKLSNNIELCDLWFKDPWEYINSIDSLILSSNFEGFGMVIAEALARGVPVISSNCDVGPKDLIVNDYNGYLYNTGDLLELKDNIKKIINKELESTQDEIASSIERMYIDNYFNKIKSILI